MDGRILGIQPLFRDTGLTRSQIGASLIREDDQVL
jgi:hypothetical protein